MLTLICSPSLPGGVLITHFCLEGDALVREVRFFERGALNRTITVSVH